jgi:hypothetical protein
MQNGTIFHEGSEACSTQYSILPVFHYSSFILLYSQYSDIPSFQYSGFIAVLEALGQEHPEVLLQRG